MKDHHPEPDDAEGLLGGWLGKVLATAVVAFFTGLASVISSGHFARQTAHETLWNEGGPHFYDLMMMQQTNILPRLDALENKKGKH